MNSANLKRFSFLLCLFSSCWYDRSNKDDQAIATINDSALTSGEYRRALKQAESFSDDETGKTIVLNDTYKRVVLDDLINERLLLAQAERAHVIVTDDEVAKIYTQATEGWRSDDLKRELLRRDMTPLEYRAALKKRLLISHYLRDFVFARLIIKDSEINDHLAKDPGMSFEQAEKDLRRQKEQQAKDDTIASLRKATRIIVEERRLAKLH
jgi:hypothetical protein